MAFVQASAFAQTTSSSRVLCVITPTAGNSLFGFASHFNATSTVRTSTDSENNTWAMDIQRLDAGTEQYLAIQHAHAVAGNPTTVAVIVQTADFLRGVVLEYSSCRNAGAVVTGSSAGTSTNANCTIATAASTLVVIAALTHETGAITFTPHADWTQRAESEDVNSGQPLAVIDRVGPSGSTTPRWTLSAGTSPGEWLVAAVAFSTGSDGGGSPTGTVRRSRMTLMGVH